MDLRVPLIGLLVLMFGAWLLAGLGDWLCHRRALIERTSGWPESALHLLLYLLVAPPIALAMFLHVNALLLAIMAAGALAHMAVSLWDTSYAQPRRHIAPLEQQIHSHLEMLPLFGVAVAALLHWQEVLEPAWQFTARPAPLPWSGGVLLALIGGLALIVEELLRCLRFESQVS